MIMAAPFPNGVSQYVQIFFPLTDLLRCWESGRGSGDRVGDGEDSEGEGVCRDQGAEGVPAPPRREPKEEEEGRVEERGSAPDQPP